ncbi:MAG: type IV secretion system DNA-binding domain-containing protein [Patescibacteria group bacterium]|nr:type IV secretion system DNA-binding domain-containing protein [Patescibacteria group bacterium]
MNPYGGNLTTTGTDTFGGFMLAIYLILVAIVIISVAILFYRFYKEMAYEKSKIPRSLNMVLLKVLITKGSMKEGEESKKGVKEFAARASQMFSSLYAIRDNKISVFNYAKGGFLSFEIVSHDEKIVFYVGIPRQLLTLVEKQIYGFYPDASLELVDRYNIFEKNNNYAAAELKLTETPSLPLKIYKEFEEDTLNAITSALSKLAKEDGAAIQVLIRPASNKWQKNSEFYIKQLQEGKSLKGIDLSWKKVGEEALKFGGELARAPFQTDKEKRPEEKPKGPKPLGEQQIKLINEKLAFVGFETIVRIIVSAPEKATAKMHLSNILSTFTVFGHAVGNKLITNKNKSEDKVVEDFIFRHFPYDARNNILNSEELASVFHFPNRTIETPNILWLLGKHAPAPPEVPKEGLFLGINTYRGVKTPIYLKPEDRLRHTYVIGKTGSGKSTLLKEMILQDIKNGEGVCFIDPHGSDLEDILKRMPKDRIEDVIYFNPIDMERPMAINMLENDPKNPLQKTLAVNELLNIFDKLYDLKTTGGPMFEQYFRNAALLVMEDPESGSTMLEIPKVLTDEDFRAFKLSRCNNPIIKNYWLKEAEKAGGDAALQNVVPYITSKMTQFLANDLMRPIIAQQKSSFNFREIMDNKKILLVNLSKGQIGEMNMSLLGLLIVSKIYLGAMSRSDAPNIRDLPPFYLYIDEFQNFASESIAGILAEARKYKLSLNIAHQFIGQLDKIELVKKAIFGNVGTRVIFRVDVEDAEFLQKGFEPVFSANDIVNLSEFSSYVSLLANGINVKPFSMYSRPDFDKINAEKSEKTFQAVKELSRIKYGRDRETVEREIRERA